jgi:hypothetical protein
MEGNKRGVWGYAVAGCMCGRAVGGYATVCESGIQVDPVHAT